jgi:hypothetical protein
MDFRKRIERALVPLVAELRDQLKLYPTLWVFNHHLLRSHVAPLRLQIDPSSANWPASCDSQLPVAIRLAAASIWLI